MIRKIFNSPAEAMAWQNDDGMIVAYDENLGPKELAEALDRRQRFDRNLAWLEAHGQEIYNQHRGKCICVAGGELFVGDTPQQVIALAKAAHPEDDGRLVHYLSPIQGPRIYANQRSLVDLYGWSRASDPTC